jgi:hypothetical protein
MMLVKGGLDNNSSMRGVTTDVYIYLLQHMKNKYSIK